MTKSDLTHELANQIAAEGPMTVAAYMEKASQVYYDSGEVFGKSGDFITAPDISQVFGELIGLWCVTAWQALGAPRHFNFVECGPGRGTLMVDALRAIAGAEPSFIKEMTLHFIERSSALRKQQEAALPHFDIEWHDSIETVPQAPSIIIGNEFLDALPIRQFVRTAEGWNERLIDWDGSQFKFITAAQPSHDVDDTFDDAASGSVLEKSEAVESVVKQVANHSTIHDGAVLMIDYGYARSDVGDSLQAVRKHTYHDVLSDPGTADITAHVDFSMVAQAARSEGAQVFGPVEQGLWLRRLGATVRETQLSAGKSKDQVAAIRNGVRRLIEPDGMGALFKVIAFASPNAGALAGFEIEP